MKTFAVTGRVETLVFAGDGRELLVDDREPDVPHDWCGGLYDRPARRLVWWDWQTGEPVHVLRLRDTLYDPTKTPEEWEEYGLRASDWDPGQPARNAFIDCGGRVVAAVWSWTNKEDGMSLFDLERGRQLEILVGARDFPYRVAFDPRERAFAVAGVCDGDGSHGFRVCRYDNGSNSAQWLRGFELGFDQAETLTLADRFVVATTGPTVRIWDWTTNPTQRPGPDASDEEWDEWEARWEAPRARAHRELTAAAPVNALVIDPAGIDVIAGTDAGLEVWRSTGPLPRHAALAREVAPVRALAQGTDGRLLVGGDGGVEWWDVRSGSCLARFDWGIGPVTAVALDPTGTLAAAGARGTVVVWDVDG